MALSKNVTETLNENEIECRSMRRWRIFYGCAQIVALAVTGVMASIIRDDAGAVRLLCASVGPNGIFYVLWKSADARLLNLLNHRAILRNVPQIPTLPRGSPTNTQ